MTSKIPKHRLINAITGSLQLIADSIKNGISISLSGGKLTFTVNVDDSTIEIDGSNDLAVKDDGITKEKINADVAGDGLGQNVNGSLEINTGDALSISSDTLDVNVDMSTISIDGSNQLYVSEVPSDLVTHDGDNPLTTAYDVFENIYDVRQAAEDPTGFSNNTNIDISYDATTRKITLTGTFEAYYRGELVTELVSGWVSPAHDAGSSSNWFLYYNGTSFVWSDTIWTFDALLIAMAIYTPNGYIGQRETHGFMPWSVHEQFHNTMGTWRESGGYLSGYTLSSTIAADRRPSVSACVIRDEDLGSTITALTGGTGVYSQFYLSSTDTMNIDIQQDDIVPLNGSQPYYNQYTGGNWVQTGMTNNNYMAVWLMAFPVSSDSASQEYRYLWVQGQQQSGTLADIQTLTPSDLELAGLESMSPEFVFIAKVIIRYIGGNWYIQEVQSLEGNRTSQLINPQSYLSSVTSDSTLTGNGTAGDPLSVDFTQIWVSAPATAASTGTQGQMAYDGSYFYICTATDTWLRVAIATW